MDTLGHLNSRERAVRLAYRKDQHDNGRGWVEPAPIPPNPNRGVSSEDTAISFEVEAVKADIAAIARTYPGGLTYGWTGDQLRLQFGGSPDVLSVEEAVRRHLIGPGRVW